MFPKWSQHRNSLTICTVSFHWEVPGGFNFKDRNVNSCSSLQRLWSRGLHVSVRQFGSLTVLSILNMFSHFSHHAESSREAQGPDIGGSHPEEACTRLLARHSFSLFFSFCFRTFRFTTRYMPNLPILRTHSKNTLIRPPVCELMQCLFTRIFSAENTQLGPGQLVKARKYLFFWLAESNSS